MKNIERSIYIVLIIILVASLTGVTTYFVMKDKNNSNPTNNEIKDNTGNNDRENDKEDKPEVLKDGITLNETVKENDKLISQKYEIVLNEKSKSLNINFVLISDEYQMEIKTDNKLGFDVYNVYRNLDTENHNNNEKMIVKLFSTEEIAKNFNENNFKIVKGTDNKSYLVIQNYVEEGIFEYYILNDNYIKILC